MANLKQKVKAFFKTKQATDATVELVRMWIIPFAKKWNPSAAVDDAVGAFFALDHRHIVTATAKRGFRMPGQYMVPPNRPTKRHSERDVVKGQQMIIVLDRIDETAKVDIIINGKEKTFLLARPEVEYLKDQVRIDG